MAALDGLRGLAALVVVLHHCAMTHPAFAQAMLRPREPPARGSTVWWLTRTPAYILVAGHEAVFIFFVLSGLVLTLPRLKSEPDPWRAYYPARLVRLYLPVVAAVLVAAVAVRLPAIHAWVGEWGRSRGGRAGLLVLLVLAVLLVCLRQELQGLGVDILVAERLDSLVIVGCALLLVVVTMTDPGRRVLESRPAQLLGSISFSLYLLHEPLVIAAHELLRGQPWWLVWITAVPASLVMALVFRVLVEEPSHQLDRRVRTRARELAPAQARPELAS